MTFTTPEFVVFALLFAPLFLASRGTARRVLLLLASYAFYAAWDVRFVALLAGSTLLDFLVAGAIADTDAPRRRRRLLFVSLVGNLGVLGVLKYYGFFTTSFVALMGRVGVELDLPTVELVLPVGISFYTFQTLSYTLDVYYRRHPPSRSWLDFANYVAFFPQLVAGPIERASRLLPQLASIGERRDADRTGWGFLAVGVFKKVVIADNLGAFVDAVYAAPESAHTPALALATYAFAAQIYCDFSGYSDLAVGVAKLMGVELMHNFDAPYSAAGPREFWRRWHISLSTWLRDYLYVPLGGNRGRPARVRFNLLATMLLGGLWHGAAWNFVLWGAFHGALLVLAHLEPLARAAARLPLWLRRVGFFHLVCIGWVLFRVGSLADGGTVLRRLATPSEWQLGSWLAIARDARGVPYLLLIAALVLAAVGPQMAGTGDTARWVARLWRMPWVVRLYVVVALIYAAVIFAPEAPPPFIYFQF